MTFQLLEACSCLDGAKGAINFCPDFMAVVSRFASTTGNAESFHPWEEMAVSRSGTAESWEAIGVCPMCSSSNSHHLHDQPSLCTAAAKLAFQEAKAAWSCSSLQHAMALLSGWQQQQNKFWFYTSSFSFRRMKGLLLRIHNSELGP